MVENDSIPQRFLNLALFPGRSAIGLRLHHRFFPRIKGQFLRRYVFGQDYARHSILSPESSPVRSNGRGGICKWRAIFLGLLKLLIISRVLRFSPISMTAN